MWIRFFREGLQGAFFVLIGSGLLSAPLLSEAAQKACVKVLGVASMSVGDEAYVRQMAIQDALKTASMQRGLSVVSQQETQDFQLTKDQTHYITQSRILGFKVLAEGPKPLSDEQMYDEKGQRIKEAKPTLYQVVLNVCLTQEPSAGCATLPVNLYQGRVAIARPLVVHPDQARDLRDLAEGMQTELLRRFRQLGYRNVMALQQGGLFQPGQMIEPNLDQQRLQVIRTRTGAQWLLLPVVRSTALVQEGGALHSMRQFYLLESAPSKRHLEMDIYLVDLFRYQMVKQFRLGLEVKGEVRVGRDRPVGTSAFFETKTGKVFHVLWQQAVLRAKQFLKCQRLEGEIIDKRGENYLVRVSQASGIKVGDQLAVYHYDQAPVQFQGMDLGVDTSAAGFLKVVRVQPNFVVTQLVGKKQAVMIGDYVKSW